MNIYKIYSSKNISRSRRVFFMLKNKKKGERKNEFSRKINRHRQEKV